MARLSDHLDYHKRTHTHGVDATSADLRRGKIAMANGVRLFGQADVKPMSLDINRNILLVQNPTGISSAAYNPILESNGGVIVQSSRVKGLFKTDCTINTNGYIHSAATSYLVFLGFTSCEKVSVINQRKYEMWGMTKNATPTTNEGVRLGFNTQHFYNQFWHVDLYWTGSVFRMDLVEWNNPTSTSRANASFSSNLDWPMIWHLIVYESGDNILVTCMAYQSNNIVDNEAITMTYTIASRPYKNSSGSFFGVRESPGDEWLVRGCSISDVP